MRRLTLFLAVALIAGCVGTPDLVRVTVDGTRIDIVPSEVIVVTEKPKDQAADLIKKGWVADPGGFVTVKFHDVRYSLLSQSQAATAFPGRSLQLGDVVYLYHVDSRQAFAKKYGLKLVKGAAKGNPYSSGVLFSASPGRYVLVVEGLVTYACPTCPGERGNKGGRCTKCGRELVETTIYE